MCVNSYTPKLGYIHSQRTEVIGSKILLALRVKSLSFYHCYAFLPPLFFLFSFLMRVAMFISDSLLVFFFSFSLFFVFFFSFLPHRQYVGIPDQRWNLHHTAATTATALRTQEPQPTRPSEAILSFIFQIFSFFGHTCPLRKFPGQGSNPHHSSDLSHCSDNARSPICCTMRGEKMNVYLIYTQKKITNVT